MLVYKDLISQMLRVVPIEECLSDLFLKSKESYSYM